MDNAGLLHREGDRFVAWFGKVYPDNEVLLAEHRHGGGVQPWHTYSEAQIERALELSELLVAHYGLQDVLGHEDIARGRKTDPGPAFPLQAVRSRALGRGQDELPRLVVTSSSLNIRSGHGAGFDKVAPALKRGIELQLLEAQDRWSQVAVVGTTDLEGWVSNDFVAPLEAARSVPSPRSHDALATVPRAARATTGRRARAQSSKMLATQEGAKAKKVAPKRAAAKKAVRKRPAK